MIRKRPRTNHFLFCPGPVIVSKNVFTAVSRNIGHREEEFSELLVSINKKLLCLFEIRDQSAYHPLLVTSSGTAANESVLSSVVGNKNVLILANGEFGERLYGISKLHNRRTKLLHFGWGHPIDVKQVEAYIKKHKVDLLYMVHHETSIGILNPAQEIGAITKKYKLTFCLDAVSSVGADKIDLEAWNVSYCTTSAGKAICSLPGLGIIMARVKDLEKLKGVPAKTMYLNLYNLYKYSKEHMQTPNTPAVHLFYAIEQALINIHKKGVVNLREDIRRRARLLRAGMKQMGLTFLIDEERMSASLTTVILPSYITTTQLKLKLKEKNIVIYNGKGPLVDRVFQVANIGELSDVHIKMFLRSLKEALSKLEPTQARVEGHSMKVPMVLFPQLYLSKTYKRTA
ncbi:MAG: pyridoxal-phosphate-dependent aminotransferase family protein [Candidatus Levyibacteriota bacterium]